MGKWIDCCWTASSGSVTFHGYYYCVCVLDRVESGGIAEANLPQQRGPRELRAKEAAKISAKVCPKAWGASALLQKHELSGSVVELHMGLQYELSSSPQSGAPSIFVRHPHIPRHHARKDRAGDWKGTRANCSCGKYVGLRATGFS